MAKRGEIQKILDSMEQVIVGKENVLELALIAFLAEGNLLIEDVPGVGKTTLAKNLAKALGCDFNRIQFTPDTLPGDVLGVSVYSMKDESFTYKPGAIMSQIVLADEINRTSPKTQAALLEAMGEKQVTVDGKTYPLPTPFMLIATQNPIDYLGTYHLPEAQLDRFLMKLSMGYPKQEEELRIIQNFLETGKGDASIETEHRKQEPEADRVLTAKEAVQMQQQVKEVLVKNELASYILEIIEETRKDASIRLGASPRATLALVHAAQAAAFVEGRDYVIPDDVKKVAVPVLAHRLVVTAEAKAGKITAEKLVQSILTRVRIPF